MEPAGRAAAAGTPAPHSETRSALDDLIAAAGGGRLDSVIDEIGAEHVTRLVIAELRCRTVPRAGAPADIALVLGHRTESWATRIHIDPAGRFEAFHSAGPVNDTDATVTQSLAEVAGNLFGPRGTTTSATRSITWRDTGAVFGTALPMFDTVRRVLDSIDRPYSPGLSELCTAAGSDKWGLHQYTRHYEHHFEAIRDRPLTVLEIGVGGYSDPRQGGGSLRMWRNYFCRAAVYGMDIVDKTALSEQRMTVLRGDQSAPADLAGVAAITGPLDIVIDDGSHIGSHIITSFHTLFPVLRAGGWYVIEDLQTAYWPSFAEGPGSPTAMDFVTGLIDGLNHAEIGGRTPCDTDTQVKGLHFYHNMVFIEKGTNRDSGAPPWVRTR
ncbi:hypothetical protein [Nocardia sp. NPDC051750]|uniref:hypothetical protein n=1 Tax=Nocardia sp. NPDC051750 TaxID=3364325 RepID=UPI0037ABD02B